MTLMTIHVPCVAFGILNHAIGPSLSDVGEDGTALW